MKRRLIIFIGLALVIAGQVHGVAQEPSMSMPTWTVGDLWTYAVEVPGQETMIATMIVTNVRDYDYMIRTIRPDGMYDVSSVLGGNSMVGDYQIGWPLKVYESWTKSYVDRSTTPPRPVTGEGKVDAYELVTVPAGTFGSFRIVLRICLALGSQCGVSAFESVRLWMAPEVKNMVKMEVNRERIPKNFKMTLVSYAVAP